MIVHGRRLNRRTRRLDIASEVSKWQMLEDSSAYEPYHGTETAVGSSGSPSNSNASEVRSTV